VGVVEQPPADAEDQRPVPVQQRLERRLVPVADESLQQVGVRQRQVRPQLRQAAEVAHHVGQCLSRHAAPPFPARV
jgi:hypothetical protein